MNLINSNHAFHKVKKKGVNWIVSQNYSSFIADEVVEKMKQPALFPDCKVIRENNVRVSVLVSLPEEKNVIFVKKYKCRGLMDIIKYFFFTSKATAEWNTISRFMDKSIPVVPPLAKGERRQFHCLLDSYFITEAFINAKDCKSFHKQSALELQASAFRLEKKNCIIKLARLIRKIHDAGFFYRDLHAGNILVVNNDNEPATLYPIDLHKVWYLRWVPLWMRIRDLAQLRNSLEVTRKDRIRFLQEYAKGSPKMMTRFREIAGGIESKADKLWREHLKSRTKRCMINSSEFAIKKQRRKVLYYDRRYSVKRLDDILKAYYQGIKNHSLSVLKETRKEKVSVLSYEYNGEPEKLVVKESRLTGLVSGVRHLFVKSRAKRCWIAARGLKVRGVATPGAIALIEERKYFLPTGNILITEYVANACELNSYVLKHFSGKRSSDKDHRRERFLKECAVTLKTLHEKGIYHADLKSNNILVKEDDRNGWILYFIDLDRVSFNKRLSFRQRANNLAQINASVASCISPAERLKFFKMYSRGMTTVEKDRKKYYAKILEIGKKKITEPYGLSFTPPQKKLI